MFGAQEILIIAGVVAAIIFLPRMQGHRRSRPASRPIFKVTGKMRAAVAISVLYPLAMAAILKPWQNDPIRFAYLGLGPVVLAWLLRWVWLGYKQK